MRRIALSIVLLSALAGAAVAQVPTPLEHFGFEPGTHRKLANWSQLSAYYDRLARSSPRVKIDTLGRAERGQPFLMLTITSEQNHARLAELHDIQMRLSDPRRVSGDAELQRLLDTGRSVVLITHGIHATEVGGGQMAARLAHRLATSNDPKIREILDNVILLQIPSLNPDGLQWTADWYNQTVGTPYEGTAAPWLYQFYTGHDNNRDWYSITQSETRLTVDKAHNAWHPHIVHDIHQMGNNGARIFFPPFIDPYEPNVDPAIIAALNQLGSFMAAEVTAQGKAGVVINAIYDGFSPARAYMHYHGGVRILSETASARLATPITQSRESIRGGRAYDAAVASWNYPHPWTGGEWGLPDIVAYMEAGALALLTNAAKNRRFWLDNFYHINRRAVDGWPSWPAAWVVPADQSNTAGLSYALNILTTGMVEVHRATAPFTAGGRSYAAGTYVIPMKQPYASFAQTLLEVQRYPDLREYPGGPPLRPYDVTAHTLPLLMDFEAVPVASWSGSPPALSPPIPLEPRRFTLPPALSGRNAPRIAYLKSWQESMEGGWTRWVFDQHGLRYDTIKDARVRAGNLRRDYDVLVLQSQSAASIRNGYAAGSMPEQYAGGIGDPGATAIRTFVEQGGRLIAIESATEFAAELFGLPVRNAVDGLRPQDFYVPGSILRLDVDAAHPIASGVDAATSAWYWGDSRAFDVSGQGVRVVARYGTGNPLQSGWILGPDRLAGRPALLEADVGQGSVVLFGFQPNYRAQAVVTWPLLFNAMAPPVRQ
ncbi:MAG: hypothetical protein L0271_08985 [Gemmatimonadetes bacterium]|nr:hypothetical protein [Gemmatimonadota bacterium]